MEAIKSTYTREEVIELLTAYRDSDCGSKVVEEVKFEYPNSFDGSKRFASKWLDIAGKSIEERATEWFDSRSDEYKDYLRSTYHTTDKVSLYKKVLLS